MLYQARNQGGFGWFVRTPPHAITLVRLVRFSYMYSASLTVTIPYCLNCTKFNELILSKIIKTVATRCQILRLKFTKFDLGWGSASDPAGELTALPRGPSESFAVVCTSVHCNCFVSICLQCMPRPDTFALHVGKSDSSICVNIVVQTSAFWL